MFFIGIMKGRCLEEGSVRQVSLIKLKQAKVLISFGQRMVDESRTNS